jgi:D-inositol-3-phosphate glycosyltransferase
MNVYVRDLSRALSVLDMPVDVRVISVPAGGPGPIAKSEIADQVPALIAGIDTFSRADGTRYDLVHSHYWISGMAGQRLATRWNVPHVHMFHTLARIKTKYAGSKPDLRREHAEIRLMETADAIVVSNPVERMQVMEAYGVHNATLVSIPCGIDTSQFQPSKPMEWHKHPQRFRVVALGRIERLKNFALLLEGVAHARTLDRRFASEVEVVLAGGPSEDEPGEAPRLREMALQLGLDKTVRFMGAVSRESLPALFAAADVCVVPSLHESFGLVALEAMASGVPVIAARSGGLQMTVVNGVSGYLVDPTDAPAMADRLLALWRSPITRQSMGVRGARAAQHYAWPVVAHRVQCLYDSLIDSKAGERDAR